MAVLEWTKDENVAVITMTNGENRHNPTFTEAILKAFDEIEADSEITAVVITSNALPTTVSGQVVNFCLPFTGGSGGPYLLEVIDGALPPGVQTDSNTVCLVGQVLQGPQYLR